MGGLLLGFALGAMAFTEAGREVGNKIGGAAVDIAKKKIDNYKSAKQSAGITRDDSPHS